MKKRGIASRVQRVLIVVLASVFFIELILLMDTQLTGNPVKGILDSVVQGSETLPSTPSCVSTAEICDGKDNDCDGSVDEEGVCYELEYTLSFDSEKLILEDYQGFIDVKVKGYDNVWEEEGNPNLPKKIFNYVIPLGKKLKNFELKDIKYTEKILSKQVVPAPPKIQTSTAQYFDRIVQTNGGVYNADSFYPQNFLEMTSNSKVQGRNMVQLLFSPVRYNPLQNKLRIITKITFNLYLEDESMPTRIGESKYILPLLANPEIIAKETNSQDTLSSTPATPYDIISNPFGPDVTKVDYLIITNDNLVDEFMPLAEWKSQKGLVTKIRTVNNLISWVNANPPNITLSMRDDAEKLRHAIQWLYQNKGLKYVLLGGDEDVVPIRYCFYYNVIYNVSLVSLDDLLVCDLYFSEMDKNWDLDNDGAWGEPSHDNISSGDVSSDVFVGRIPLNTHADVSAAVQKIINYEKNPGNGDSSYLTKVITFASDQMRDIPSPDYDQGDYFVANLTSNFTIFAIDNSTLDEKINGSDISPSSPFGGQIIDKLSEGYGIIGYFSHGFVDRFRAKGNGYGNSGNYYVLSGAETPIYGHGFIEALENTNKPSAVFSVSCDNGMFDGDKVFGISPSVAETFLKSLNTGAFAFIGYSRWGWVDSSYIHMRPIINFAVNFNQPLGIAISNGKLQYSYMIPLNYGLNLLGDPETTLYSRIPPQLNISASGVNSQLSVQITSGGHIVTDEVSISVKGNVDGWDKYLAFKTTTGSLSEDVSDVLEPENCSVFVTVSAPNYLPAQKIIGLCQQYRRGTWYDGTPNLEVPTDTAYCPSDDCVYNGVCYSHGGSGDWDFAVYPISHLGNKALICSNYGTDEYSVWLNPDYFNGYCQAAGYYWHTDFGDANLESSYSPSGGSTVDSRYCAYNLANSDTKIKSQECCCGDDMGEYPKTLDQIHWVCCDSSDEVAQKGEVWKDGHWVQGWKCVNASASQPPLPCVKGDKTCQPASGIT